MTEPGDSKRWLARATTQFARTVYTELRRAGHAKEDIVRFVNEMMDLLSKEAGSVTTTVKPPALVDPEAGLPDRETIEEIFEFELRRAQKDRRKERLAVFVLDVVLPGYITGAIHSRAHEQLTLAIQSQLRMSDALGKLGPDRYMLIAAKAKDGVVPAIIKRMQGLLDRIGSELPEISIALRFTECDAQTTGLMDVLERCFAKPPVLLAPVASAPVTQRPPRHTGPPAMRQIVLALGGGAARAASHVGVVRELQDAGVRTVGVAGCSAGGLIGAMLVRGKTPDQIVERFAGFTSTMTYREIRRSYAVFLREARAENARNRNRYFGGTSMAFYSHTVISSTSTELLHGLVEYFVGPDCDIHSLPLPFAVVATDLVEGRAAMLAHGSLHEALAATCAVPGLFPPQRIGQRLLVDGSAVSELPVGAAQLLGVNAPILGVYLMRPEHRVTDYSTSAEVATRANALAHAELVREQLRHAQYLISVPVHDAGWLEFRQAERISQMGRDAAKEALPRILERMDHAAAAK